jgi:hypothetical protein
MNLICEFPSNTGNRVIYVTSLYQLIIEYVNNYVGFEVLTAVTMEIALFLGVRPCRTAGQKSWRTTQTTMRRYKYAIYKKCSLLLMF